jgi:hypothetical protein
LLVDTSERSRDDEDVGEYADWWCDE